MMRALFQPFALVAAFAAMALGPSARSEDADQAVYAVAYIEILPGREKQGRRLLLDHVADARRAAGAIAFDALVRDGYPDQFALLEQWQSQKARDEYASSASVQDFRAALGKIESAALDERIHGELFVESEKPAPLPPVVVMTHIDVIPPALEAARRRIGQLVDGVRHGNANLRYDVLVQTNRQNHMTLIEGWKSQADKNAQRAAAETVSFRHDLLPMSGSPYDERTYRPLRE
ncbi:MAG: antibiotic biosynthesis monooxygenase [Bradyrhizobium sp.]|nr:antibiotic biosynthesis monooxygenase [Bradyrhizobium sp.]MBV9970067.1 antibiotic biosynthesis monooxygenase [Xanthobacteraceae bacterium]